jgi:hypothetical protein
MVVEYEEPLIAMGSGEVVENTGLGTIILSVNVLSAIPPVFEALIVKVLD